MHLLQHHVDPLLLRVICSKKRRARRDKNRTLFLGHFIFYRMTNCAEGAPWYDKMDHSDRASLIKYLRTASKKRPTTDISLDDERDCDAEQPKWRPLVVASWSLDAPPTFLQPSYSECWGGRRGRRISFQPPSLSHSKKSCRQISFPSLQTPMKIPTTASSSRRMV